MSRNEQVTIRDMKRRWAVKCSLGELFCFLCGKQITNMRNCSADHWIPKALGGKSTEDNLKPACISCNHKKGCMSPEEFLAHKEEVLSKEYHSAKKERKKLKKQQKIKKSEIKKQKRQKKKEEKLLLTASYKLKQPYELGETIYYVKIDLNREEPRFEVKEGVIIGFTYKNTVEYVLIKDFYVDQEGNLKSELLDVVPLTKIQAIATKLEYEKIKNHIIQQQKQIQH